ncbi:chondrolectin-like [Cyanocitta cristata]
MKPPVTAEREIIELFLKRVERKTLGTTSVSVSSVSEKIMEQILLRDNVLEKELGDRAEPEYDIFPTVPAGNPYDTSKPEDQYHIIATETGIIPNLIYVVIPTIPLLLLILVAFGTCCFQMLHKREARRNCFKDPSPLSSECLAESLNSNL